MSSEIRTKLPKCHTCGRFMHIERGVAWKMVYSGGPAPEPEREIYRCLKCVKVAGEFTPQAGIVPAYSCGLIQGSDDGASQSSG